MLGTAIVGGLCALVGSLCLTPLIRWSARQLGYVAYPRQDRWHHKPTALFGGVAIFLAFFLPFVALHEFDKSILFILAGAAIIFGLGLAVALEAPGKAGVVLQSLELGLGEGVVV